MGFEQDASICAFFFQKKQRGARDRAREFLAAIKKKRNGQRTKNKKSSQKGVSKKKFKEKKMERGERGKGNNETVRIKHFILTSNGIHERKEEKQSPHKRAERKTHHFWAVVCGRRKRAKNGGLTRRVEKNPKFYLIRII